MAAVAATAATVDSGSPSSKTAASPAAAAAAGKKKANSALVSPFAHIRMNGGLGLIAAATRQAAAKTNLDAASASDSPEGLLASVKYDARKLASASFRTTVTALVLTPAVSAVPPRPAVGDKRPFPGFAKIWVLVMGPPGSEMNSVGLKTPGNSLAPSGRIAYLEAQTIEVAGYDEERQKKQYKQRASTEKAVLTEGTEIEITVVGQSVRPTHNRDGSEIQEKARAAQPEIKPDDVVSMTLDDIVLHPSGHLQAKATRIQLRGTVTEGYANAATKAFAEAMQRPFKPLVLDPNFDWTKIKVERKKKNGGGEAGGDAAQGGDEALAAGSGGGGGSGGGNDDAAGDKPTNDKVQAAGAACMRPESAAALWTNYIVGTLGTPQDTLTWREAAGLPVLINGSPVFDPFDSTQWTKKARPDESAPKPGEPVPVQIRYVVPVQQFEPLTPVQINVRTVLLNQTIPPAVLSRFGISDPDYQPFIRMLVPNGLFAMRASPMTAGWMAHEPAPSEEFSQAFYPRMRYTGDRGNKTADPKSAAFYVDHAATLLNACVPVTREFVTLLMLIMQQYVSKTRYNYDMNTVKKAARKDSMGRQIEDNFLDTRTDDTGTQAVVNVFEGQFNVVKELAQHAFYVLIENVPKTNEVIQAAFARYGDHVAAYLSAMLVQALVVRYNIHDLAKLLSNTEQLLEMHSKTAEPLLKQTADAESGAGMDELNPRLPEDYFRPKGSPPLKALLGKVISAHDRASGTATNVPNPNYIGDNALQLSPDEIKAFRLLPWAISLNHLKQRGLPVVYAGTSVHYDVIYPRVKAKLDADAGVMPLEEMVEMRRREIEPLLEAERKRQEALDAAARGQQQHPQQERKRPEGALAGDLSPEEEAAIDAAMREQQQQQQPKLASDAATDTKKRAVEQAAATDAPAPSKKAAAAAAMLDSTPSPNVKSGDAKRLRRELPASFMQLAADEDGDDGDGGKEQADDDDNMEEDVSEGYSDASA